MTGVPVIRIVQGAFGRLGLQPLRGRQAPHAHAQAQVMLCLGEGEVSARVGEQRCTLSQATGLAINPCTRHAVDPPSAAMPVLSLHLDPDWLAEHGFDVDRPFASVEFRSGRVLRDAALRLGRLLEEREAVEGAEAVEDLALLVLDTAGGTPSAERAESTVDRRLRRSVDAMQAGVGERERIERVARDHGLSRPHFFKLFQQTYRLTPGVYWNMLRMEQALREIGTTDKAVGSVASELGFSAQANFSRFFRGVEGLSPIEYRRALSPSA